MSTPTAAKPFVPLRIPDSGRPRRYVVTHQTEYTYDAPVSSSYGRCYLTPRDLTDAAAYPQQIVEKLSVEIEPAPADSSTGSDINGNVDTFFHVTYPHTRLDVSVQSTVTVFPLPPALLTAGPAVLPWELARPSYSLKVGGDGAAAAALATQFALDLYPPEITDLVHDYAAAIFTPERPLLEAVCALTSQIYADFTYKSGSTTISSSVDSVLRARTGVCQDFARVALACMRSVGLAGRYISGYLATEPPPGQDRVVGADATHAWAAVWLPGDQWLPFDPTNNKLVDERHVTVAWGRDYEDVPPLRGVIYTDSKRSKIKVSVDVAPEDGHAELPEPPADGE